MFGLSPDTDEAPVTLTRLSLAELLKPDMLHPPASNRPSAMPRGFGGFGGGASSLFNDDADGAAAADPLSNKALDKLQSCLDARRSLAIPKLDKEERDALAAVVGVYRGVFGAGGAADPGGMKRDESFVRCMASLGQSSGAQGAARGCGAGWWSEGTCGRTVRWWRLNSRWERRDAVSDLRAINGGQRRGGRPNTDSR